MLDRTVCQIPLEVFDAASPFYTDPDRLTLLFHCYPHVIGKDPKDIAKAMGIPKPKYDDWKRNTYAKVIKHFKGAPLARTALNEDQRKFLQELTGSILSNPTPKMPS